MIGRVVDAAGAPMAEVRIEVREAAALGWVVEEPVHVDVRRGVVADADVRLVRAMCRVFYGPFDAGEKVLVAVRRPDGTFLAVAHGGDPISIMLPPGEHRGRVVRENGRAFDFAVTASPEETAHVAAPGP